MIKIIGILICGIMIVTTSTTAGFLHILNPTENQIFNWEEHKLIASNGNEEDHFGNSVAVYGDFAFIGAYWATVNEIDHSGTVYIFEREQDTWNQVQQLISPDISEYEHFGHTIAVWEDYAIIGADWNNNENGEDAGAAYIYKNEGGTWVEKTKLIASDGGYLHQFGFSVSIHEECVIIGAPNHDTGKGAAYIFRRNNENWIEEAILNVTVDTDDNSFAHSVSIHDNYVIIGACTDDENGLDAGAAHIFKKEGSNWIYVTKLISSDGSNDDYFGVSVSIRDDCVLVGAPHYTFPEGQDDPGSVYFFKNNNDVWTEEAKLMAFDEPEYDDFGSSLFFDGNKAIVGIVADNSYKTWVYIFNFDGEVWDDEAKLSAQGGEIGDSFGEVVSIYNECAIVGASSDNNENGIYAGAAYIFMKDITNQPPFAPTINGPTKGKIGDHFTYTVIAEDPDGNNVFYEIDWGDGSTEDWFGPYESNELVKKTHGWQISGNFTIKARAKDTSDDIGEWGTLEVYIPRTRTVFNKPFNSLFSRFTQLFPILRILKKELK